MILSNVEIQGALDDGRLVIDPRPEPARPAPGRECPYNTTSVDLRLGSAFSVPKQGRPFAIDLGSGTFAALHNPENYEHVIATELQPFRLDPGRFVLAQTLEWLDLPLGEEGLCLAARVEGRSSFARCGMLVHFTAPTIHAGFSGHITLELANLSPTAILLRPGVYVCQLILEEVAGGPFPNPSQFHGQKRPGGR